MNASNANSSNDSTTAAAPTGAPAPGDDVAIVTGSAGGIGKAIALRLAAGGWRVAVCDLNADGADATARKLATPGLAVPVDATDNASVRAAVQRVGIELGPVSALVNCIGWDKMVKFVDTDEDFWYRIVELNFLGMLRFTHAVLPMMIERTHGRIINISSDAARVGSSMEAVYSGAKGGVVAFTKSLAREVARASVTANVVCPGPTRTPLLDQLVGTDERGAKTIDAIVRAVPMKRLGEPGDIGGAIAFLAGPEADFITGQTLSVSGGLTMA